MEAPEMVITSLHYHSRNSPEKRQKQTYSKNSPPSLMSVGKTADDGNMSISTKDCVTVYKEENVLITCQKNPIFISKRDERGRYRIPLTQYNGQWQPHRPTKDARRKIQQAYSVYYLPYKE